MKTSRERTHVRREHEKAGEHARSGGRAASQPKPPFPDQGLKPPGIEARMHPAPRYLGEGYRGADKLAGRIALITGADSGIGRSVAVLFAREGADIAMVYLPAEQEDADVTAKAVRREGRDVLQIAGDIREADFCRSAVEQCIGHFGSLHVLVNNAAFQKHQSELEELSEEQLERTFRTNVFGMFHLVKAALPHLGEGSAIVNTGSITGLEGSEALLDYSATKGAIHAFTKSLARNLVKRGIRVNCVAPGPVWTPLNPADVGKEARDFGADTPLGRPAQPEEIAPAFVYFASNIDSSYVTGEVLTLLGGETRAA